MTIVPVMGMPVHTVDQGRLIWNANDLELSQRIAEGYGLNVRDYGANADGTDDAPAFRDAQAAAESGDTVRWVYVPAGDYHLSSQTGTGRDIWTIKINSDNIRWTFAEGARIYTENGSMNRAFIIRECQHVIMEGPGELIYSKADLSGQTGISIESSSDVTIRGLTVRDFPQYGISMQETGNSAVNIATTISYSAATNRISDSANGFTGGPLGYQVGCLVTVVGSTSNNGVYHVDGVDVAGGWIHVVEALTTEAAGSSLIYIKSTGISFTVDGTIDSFNGGLLRFPDTSQITVSGSVHNDGTYDVDTVSQDGTSLNVSGPLIFEAAGANVTITRVGRSSVNTQYASACNNIVVEYCKIMGVGVIGIEDFPKRLSYDHEIRHNYIYNCGWKVRNGPGMKPGQGVIGCNVHDNLIAHCPMGIQIGNWESMTVHHNIVENGYQCGITMTLSNHQKYYASFTNLVIAENDIRYVPDYNSGQLFSPLNDNTIDATRSHYGLRYGAININGLRNTLLGPVINNGPILITNNRCDGWGIGLSMDKSLVALANITWRGNRFNNCRTSRVVTLDSYGRFTVGSAVITGVTLAGEGGVDIPGTAGWYRGIPIVSDTFYIADGTVVLDIDPAAQTITMSTTAVHSDPGTPIGFRSALPSGTVWDSNIFSEPGGTSTVQLMANNGRILNNKFYGMGAYALSVKGTGTTVRGNEGYALNQSGAAGRSFILLNEQGSYKVIDNYVEVATITPGTNTGGVLEKMIIGTVATTPYGLGGTIFAELSDNKSSLRALQGSSGITISGPPVRYESGMTIEYGTQAPTGDAHRVGDRCINLAPTASLNIREWSCSSAGTPGSWIAIGNGSGTLISRPTPTAQDSGYQYLASDDNVLYTWNGTTWIGGGVVIKPAQQAFVFDEFLGNNGTSGNVGQIGWTYGGFTAAASVSVGGGRLGAVRLTTPGTLNAVSYIYPSEISTGIFNSGTVGWDMTFIFRPAGIGGIANGDWRFGCMTNPVVWPQPAAGSCGGVWADFRQGDTTWQLVSRALGTSDTQRDNTGIGPLPTANSWNRIRIRLITGGVPSTIGFTVGSGTEYVMTVAAGVTGQNVTPFVQVVDTAASSSRTIDLDAFYMTIPVNR